MKPSSNVPVWKESAAGAVRHLLLITMMCLLALPFVVGLARIAMDHLHLPSWAM